MLKLLRRNANDIGEGKISFTLEDCNAHSVQSREEIAVFLGNKLEFFTMLEGL